MSDQNEMVMVEMKPGDVRRVNPRDLDQFLAANPGAKAMGDQAEEAAPADPEAKAVEKAPANKARSMGMVDKK